MKTFSPLLDIRKFGCVLLRFRFPNGEDFHVSLHELGQPRIQHLLSLLSKLLGVPLLLPPSEKFTSALQPRREHVLEVSKVLNEETEEIFAYG